MAVIDGRIAKASFCVQAAVPQSVLGNAGEAGSFQPLSGVTTSQLPIPEILNGLLTPLLPVISPITGLATKISFTDPDGTQQTFNKRSDGTYDHPPGVNLQLRRFATGISLTEPKAWAMTRPDGVTYYFDSLGYATSIQDRNANVITFKYEFYNPQTGGGCLVQLVDGVLCAKRVQQVVDPGSRTIDIRYRTPQLLGGLPNFGLPIPVGKKPGSVDRIIDHRSLAPATRRVTKFDYDTDGYLTALTEGLKENGPAATATTDETRITRFAYTDAGASANRQLSQVIDPKNQTTKIEYVAPNDPYQLIGGTGAPVKSITNRRNFKTDYTFASATNATTATVKDALNRTSTYTLDLSGRMTQMVDPRPATLKLEWNANNNVEKMTAAAGTPDEAVTTMTYNTNGLLLTRTDPASTAAAPKVLTLAYRDAAGTQLAAGDAGKTFVSDLTSMTQPEGNATTFGLDARGNATSRTDGEQKVAQTTFDVFGQIQTETDEVGNVTKYEQYDTNGMAQQVVAPRGVAADPDGNGGRWIYRYDDAGNTLSVTDPRAGAAATVANPGTNFTTSMTYDALDRPTRTSAPKDSPSDNAVGDAGDPAIINRDSVYDANNNITKRIDGERKETTATFTAMDAVSTVTTPMVPHGDTSAPETTRYVHDAVDNVIRVVSPRGESTTTDGDFETEYRYDTVDQKVAEIAHSTDPGEDPTLATSWAYDLRGNQVAMVDPRQNARFSAGTPEQNAQTPANRRFSYEFDKSDNMRAQVEDPGGENDRSEFRYDRNDRIVAKVDPRGNEANANPDQYTWLYGYDGRDLMTSTDSPAVAHAGETGDARRRTEYKRRADGKIERVIAPRGTASSGVANDFETVLDYDADGNLKSRTLPRAPSQYGPPLKVSYARDAVGNPKQITDARRHSFTNTFYDSGDLKSTARPSWWSYDDEAMSLQERTVEEITKANSAGDSPREQTAIATSDFGDIKPEPMPDWLPNAGDTTFGYDAEMRLTRVTDTANIAATIDHDPLGRVTSTTRPFNRDAGAPASQRDIVNKVTYDFNGNMLSQTDGQRTDGTDIVTRYGYDQYDRQTDETAPGANEGAEVTHSTYDGNGNVTDVQTPRETHIASSYDRLDRLTSTTDGKGNRTSYEYDAAANKVAQTTPRGNVAGLTATQRAKYTATWTYDGAGDMRSATDGLDQATTFGYDRDANQVRVVAPGAKAGPDDALKAQITVRTFDGRDLPWSTTTGTGANARTTITEFDGNGNPRRDVKPRGVNASGDVIFNDNYAPDTATTDFPALSDSTDVTRHATVREYDNDDLLTSIHMPWGPGDGDNGVPERKRYRMDFAHDSRGRVTTIDAPYEWSQTHPKAQRTKYGHYENGWVSSVSDQRIKNPAPGQTDPQFAPDHQHDYTYDTRGLQTDWRSDKGRRIHREFYDNKQLRSRSARASATDATPRVYDYEYDKNGSLTKLIDPQLDGGRTTAVSYDDADRPVRFNETWGGGRDTAYVYDEDSHVTTRKVDGQVTTAGGYTNGRVTNFAFDEIGRETTMTVVVPDAADRVTKTEYWPSSQVSLRDRRGSKGAVERTYFTDDARISRMTRDNQAGARVKDQAYSYDENANRTKDERGTHEYNARDQLTRWTRSSTYPHPGTTVTYDLNAAGAILKSTDEGLPSSQQQTTYDYTEDQGPGLKFIGDRLIKSTQDGLTTNYEYNALGDITKIDAPQGTDTDYTYDDFERRTKTTGPGDTAGETYSYDALDRRDKRTKAGTTFDYSYVALTEKLSREKTGDGSDARTYDYDAGLRMQGQTTSDGASTAAYRSYALDASGSVEGLESTNGGLADTDTYQYDPYGEIVNSTSLSTTASAAPLRFEGFYLDSGVKTYDMQARSYRPDIGRFLSQDRFEAASGDLALQSDPLTQNRYAFAGGNPVGNVEFDGHDPWAIESQCKESGAKNCGTRVAEASAAQSGPAPLKKAKAASRRIRVDAARRLGVTKGRPHALLLQQFRIDESLAGSVNESSNQALNPARKALGQKELDAGRVEGQFGDTLGAVLLAFPGAGPAITKTAQAGGRLFARAVGAIGSRFGISAASKALSPVRAALSRLSQVAQRLADETGSISSGSAAKEAEGTLGPRFAPGKWLPHFEKHAAEFGYKNSVEYLKGARDLVGREGVQTFTRTNGDRLFYDAVRNEFAAMRPEGVLRTYFRPKNGSSYWQGQTGG